MAKGLNVYTFRLKVSMKVEVYAHNLKAALSRVKQIHAPDLDNSMARFSEGKVTHVSDSYEVLKRDY